MVSAVSPTSDILSPSLPLSEKNNEAPESLNPDDSVELLDGDIEDPLAVPKKSVAQKIKHVAKIIFSLLLTALSFFINPIISFISFVVGVAFSKVVEKAVEKIQNFVKRYKWPVLVGCAILTGLALPIVLATGSVMWNAYIGSYLSNKAQDQMRE